jgi:hypothetical protein
MSDADVSDYIVGDIDRMPGTGRWAEDGAQLSFQLVQAGFQK